MANETATLAAYVADLKFADIPPEVLERAKVLTLDFLGSAIRARRVCRISSSERASRSTPWSVTDPSSIRPGGRIRRSRARGSMP